MTTYTINNRKYRVTNGAKFVLSTLFIVIVLLAIVGTAGSIIYKHMSEIKQERIQYEQEHQLAVLTEKYSFTIDDIHVNATSAEEALDKAKILLKEQVDKNKEQAEIITSLQEKYDTDIQQAKEITRNDVKLYNQFAYAIDYPGSDMTLDDIKMITNISKEEGVNPHLWLSLVQLESKYKSYSRSSISTASGWGQVLSGTGRAIYEKQLKLGKYDPYKMGINKEINARISIHYLSYLIRETGSVEKALISYNGGELGYRYVNTVASNLKKNTGLSLSNVGSISPPI